MDAPADAPLSPEQAARLSAVTRRAGMSPEARAVLAARLATEEFTARCRVCGFEWKGARKDLPATCPGPAHPSEPSDA